MKLAIARMNWSGLWCRLQTCSRRNAERFDSAFRALLFEKYVIFEKKIFNSAGQTELNFYGPNIILWLFYWGSIYGFYIG